MKCDAIWQRSGYKKDYLGNLLSLVWPYLMIKAFVCIFLFFPKCWGEDWMFLIEFFAFPIDGALERARDSTERVLSSFLSGIPPG